MRNGRKWQITMSDALVFLDLVSEWLIETGDWHSLTIHLAYWSPSSIKSFCTIALFLHNLNNFQLYLAHHFYGFSVCFFSFHLQAWPTGNNRRGSLHPSWACRHQREHRGLRPARPPLWGQRQQEDCPTHDLGTYGFCSWWRIQAALWISLLGWGGIEILLSNCRKTITVLSQVNSCTIVEFNLLQILAFKDRAAHVAFLLKQG